MEHILRQYGWTLRLAGIAAACLLLALAINGFVSSSLAPYTVPLTPDLRAQVEQQKSGPERKNPRQDENWSKAISERCFFGCEDPVDEASEGCPPQGCPEGQQCVSGQCVEAEPLAPVVADGALPVLSDLNLKLIGVMVSNKPEWSTALLEDQGTKQTYVVRTAEEVIAQTTLMEVKRDRIIIERNGRLEFIRLVDALTGNPSARAAAAVAQAAPAASRIPEEVAEAIEQAEEQQPEQAIVRGEDGSFQVDRETMDKRLADRAELAKGATIVPNYSGGKKNGLKLVNVSADSVYQQLGLQSGDVLKSVNGTPIRSQSHAMELMERFRESDSVALEVERSGEDTKFKYDIK